jgi:hypothetical protein
MWCKKRVTKKDLILRFGDGKHKFYLESVCGMPVEEEGDLMCKRCLKLQMQYVTQYVCTFPHGLVNDIYTPESHIFDGPWYHKRVKAYGVPSQKSIEVAMKAQKRAQEGTRSMSVKDLIVALSESSGSSSDTINEFCLEDEQKKTAKPAKIKLKRVDKIPVLTKLVPEIQFLETMDDPIEVEEIVDVVYEKFKYDEQECWIDVETRNVYEKSCEGGKGECLGTWNPETKELECV